ncbi:type II secretion system GspH family protein [Acidovorax sp. LjRoot118]|uniref:hypothetical protein n=1 Tax=Acidovorax sp. LjRoot118 TaxID=3342256 RepID=UPI003ECCB743
MNSNQQGNFMIEALLAVLIVGMMAAATVPMMQEGRIEQNARSAADDMVSFQQAAAQHFISNRSAYETAMKDGTGADKLCKVGIDPVAGTGGMQANSVTKKTCAVDGSMLKYLLAMPDDMNLKNRYGESWVAIYRLIYDTETPPAPTGAVDMLVVSAAVAGAPAPQVVPDGQRHKEGLAAAAIVGGSGGLVPDADRATCVASKTAGKYEVCGNGWRVNLSDFVDAPDLAAFSDRLAN